MKKIILIFIVIIASFSLRSQFTYFNNRYNNDTWSGALTILETDSGFTICGVGGQESNGYIFHRIVITSIDQSGNQMWWKSYGEDYHAYYAGIIRSCIKTSDGGYAVSGSITDTIRDVLLTRTDSMGNVIWSNTYGDLNRYEVGYSIAQLPQGDLLIGLNKQSYGNDYSSDPGLLKVDSMGNNIWMKYYGGDKMTSPAQFLI